MKNLSHKLASSLLLTSSLIALSTEANASAGQILFADQNCSYLPQGSTEGVGIVILQGPDSYTGCASDEDGTPLIKIATQDNYDNAFTVDPAHGTFVTSEIVSLDYKGANAAALYVETTGYNGRNGDSSGTFSSATDGAPGFYGSNISVKSASQITTYAKNANGIEAYSKGGNGGAGGDGGSVHGGGNGGTGGNGGAIKLANYGTITTSGDGSIGVLGHSDGGTGGGAGDGDGVFGRYGGTGGAGGNSGNNVDLINNGEIITTGANAPGLIAKSTGGNGGDGGSSNSLIYALGGAGGNGGNGLNVSATSTGKIITEGDNAHGIGVYSVGGGGGHGGDAKDISAFVGVAIGGAGGGGGTASNATVNLTGGFIDTAGVNAKGIIAQSIGGGGGDAGSAAGVAAGVYGSFQLSMGGSGGNGGSGSNVSVNTAKGTYIGTNTFINYNGVAPGTTKINGDQSTGILAQSIGGGGGSGGHALAIALAGGDDGSLAVTAGLGGSGGSGGHGSIVNVSVDGVVATQGRYADGILAQSIGGGGGAGGSVIDVSASGSAGLSGSVAIGVGGSGGGGGDSGLVNADYSGEISTFSSGSKGVVAQSIGGGGGSGGSVINVSSAVGKNAAAVNVGVGGSGGSGGKSDIATITGAAGGSVSTGGHQSHGLVAQSVGGGGGTGGSVNSYAISLAGKGDAGAVSVGVGGSGGSGNSSAKAEIALSGAVTTLGDDSHGAFVQSIGGGGGAGGHVFALSLSASLDSLAKGGGSQGNRASAISASVGGNGGSGNDAGEAHATLDGQAAISTSGVRSSGLVAQSIGGGGGSAGYAHSFAVSTSIPLQGDRAGISKMPPLLPKLLKAKSQAKASLNLTISVGGAGGASGHGGAVNVELADSAKITTLENQSYGVFAQSIGGGGGSGGSAQSDNLVGFDSTALLFDLGGKGGGAGNGGAVMITDTSAVRSNVQIETSGVQAHGILAQSIGGGGGEGGSAVSQATQGVPAIFQSGQGLTLGADGGTGGSGGDVTVEYEGRLFTTGNSAMGIVAQSVGGGGGSAGTVTNAGIIGDALLYLGILQAESGVSRGSGKAIIDTSGMAYGKAIITRGDLAPALLAQSVSGGGGLLSVANSASLTAGGGASAINIGFGGQKFTGEAHNPIASVIGGGEIETRGFVSPAVFVQAIGGSGGLVQASRFSESGTATPIILTGGDTESINGSSAQASFTDTADATVTVTTSGGGSHGIVVQSLSGFGGAILVDAQLSSTSVDHSKVGGYSVGANYSASSNANLAGTVTTSGDHAHAVVLQSGYAAFSAFGTNGIYNYDLKDKNAGSLFPADFSSASSAYVGGKIKTTGKNSDGLRLESLSQSARFTANARINGSISVSGENSWAITVERAPQATYFSLIDIQEGAVITASGAGGGGIRLSGLPTSKINNFNVPEPIVYVGGTINAKGLTAISTPGASNGSKADVMIATTGVVFGDIINSSVTAQNSNFQHYDLYNQGSVTGSIIGADYHLVGTHVLEIDPTASAGNALKRTSISADSTGQVQLKLTSLPTGNFVPFVIQTSAQYGAEPANVVWSDVVAGSSNAPAWLSTPNSALASYAVQAGNGGDYGYRIANITADASQLGLSGNDGSLASYATALISTVGQAQAPSATSASARSVSAVQAVPSQTQSAALNNILLSSLNASSADELSDILKIFNASEHYAVVESVMLAANEQLNDMQSCGDLEAAYTAIAQTNCNWAKISYRETKTHDGDHSHSSWRASLGRQAEVAPDVHAGYSAGYEKINFDGLSSSTEGHRLHLGAIVKAQKERLLGSASIAVSYSFEDAIRSSTVDGEAKFASSDLEALAFVARLRGGYLIETGGLDFLPLIELNAGVVHDSGYRETGVDDLNIMVDADTQFMAEVRPALRIGGDVKFDSGMRLRGFVEGGALFALNEAAIKASLPDSQGAVHTLALNSERENVIGTFSSGLTLDLDSRIQTQLKYDFLKGDRTESHGISVKVGLKF